MSNLQNNLIAPPAALRLSSGRAEGAVSSEKSGAAGHRAGAGAKRLTVAVLMPLATLKGGAEMALVHLVQHGRDSGVRWIIVFLEDGPMVQQVQSLGGTAHVIASGRLRQPHRFAAAVVKIARLLKRERADAVLGWMGQPHLYGSPAARLARIPALWFQHGLPLGSNVIDRVATALPARGILACSQAVADVQAALWPRRAVRVVYPGADLERFDPANLPTPDEARRRLGLPAGVPIVGMVGRMQRWKGMHVLIEAMPLVLQKHPDALCVLVGGEHALEPDYPAVLRSQIDSLGLSGQVRLPGLQQNVAEWMQAMDVVVHASDHEPFGIVVVEAMALGKPVVASDAAGPSEVITAGVNGLLCPFGDSVTLSDRINRYLDDPEFARRVGAAAKERAHDFSAEHFADEVAGAVGDLVRSAP